MNNWIRLKLHSQLNKTTLKNYKITPKNYIYKHKNKKMMFKINVVDIFFTILNFLSPIKVLCYRF